MVVYCWLVFCVGFVCIVLVWVSSVVLFDCDVVLVEIGCYCDQVCWLDVFGVIECVSQQQFNDDLLFKLCVLILGDIGNVWCVWELYQQWLQLFDEVQKQCLEGDYLVKFVVWSLVYSSSEDSCLEEVELILVCMQCYFGG